MKTGIHYSSNHPFRTLLRLADMRISTALQIVFFFILKHSPIWLLPLALGWMLTVLRHPDQYGIWWFYAVMGGMALVQIQNVPTHYLFVKILSQRVRHLEFNLRSGLVRRLQQLSIGFHDSSESGRLQAKVLRDVEAVEQFSRQAAAMFLGSVSGIIFTLCYTLATKPWVTLFFVVAAPLCAVLIRSFRGPLRARNREFRTTVEGMSARVSEMIDMTHVTRAHGVENQEIAVMEAHLSDVSQSGLKLDKLQGLFGATSWVTFQLTQGGCLMVTGLMCWHGYLEIEHVVVFQGLFTIIVNNIQQILNLMPMFSKGMESMRSLGEILECPDLEHNEGKTCVDTVSGAVRFENVSFCYNGTDRPAVQNFSLDVPAGRCVAFVGDSGSGKSTCMSLLIGFYRATHGAIFLDGYNMEELDLRSWRKKIAVVSQNVVLFSGTLRENICYGLDEVDEARFQQVLEAANVTAFLDKLPNGLQTVLGENGTTLSGGQRQRVAIARALIRDPAIIILDEATSALDVISEKLVQDAIDNLIANRTTFIVAHRLSTIRCADEIVVLKDGTCIERGSADDLLARQGEFSRLKALQS